MTLQGRRKLRRGQQMRNFSCLQKTNDTGRDDHIKGMAETGV
jgi:hypothetical protein